MRPCLITILFLCSFATASLAAVEGVQFEKDILPFFADHCLECHGTDKAKGGLSLTTRKAALKTLESGSLGIVPGAGKK